MTIIEKDIPPPARKKIYSHKYPWAMLEVGDSFESVYPPSKINYAQTACWHATKKNPGKKFVSQIYLGHVRIWRVE